MIVLPPSKPTLAPSTADIHGMREHNEGLVVRSLWNAPEGLSRAGLARKLGLSRSTVSAIVHALLTGGLVRESHRARSTGGRRPIVLRFQDEHRHVIGIDLGASHITIVRTDLRGKVVVRESVQHDVQDNPRGTLALLDKMLAVVCEGASPPLLGLGVGVPCPVDGDSRHHLSPRILPAWRDTQLGDWLYERLGIPVYLDNDANVGALAEAWWGAGRGVDHFAYIKVGTGVGSGYVLDGAPYRGSSGIAGEIGHTTVNLGGRRCRCGLQGCLEAEIGSSSIVEKAREALAEGSASSLRSESELSLPRIIAHARDGDLLATSLTEEAGVHLGIAVANLLNMLNPGRVVLGGRLTTAGAMLLDPLRKTVRERALSTSIERADIVRSALGEDHVAIGAATLVVQHALKEPQRFFHTPLTGRGAGANPSYALS